MIYIYFLNYRIIFCAGSILKCFYTLEIKYCNCPLTTTIKVTAFQVVRTSFLDPRPRPTPPPPPPPTHTFHSFSYSLLCKVSILLFWEFRCVESLLISQNNFVLWAGIASKCKNWNHNKSTSVAEQCLVYQKEAIIFSTGNLPAGRV